MAYLEATLLADNLPADAQLVGVAFDDAVSALYTVTIDFATSDPDLDLVDLLGKPVAVVIQPEHSDTDLTPLTVHGQIEAAEYVDARAQLHHYRVVLAPLIQALAHRVRSRIFQDQDAIEVVKLVLKDAGIPADTVVWDVKGTYPKREYCVQYQESELAFVLRLLEEEGIFFWFEHTESGHVLHLGDDSTSQPPIAGDPTMPAKPELHADIEAVSELVLTSSVAADVYLARDWDFHSPDKPAEAVGTLAPDPILQRYEYPGTFHGPADGPRVATVRAQEMGMRARLLRGTSGSLRLLAGRKVTIEGAAVQLFDGDYVLLAVGLRYRAPFFESEGDSVSSFECTFEAVPATVPVRPLRRTPKPRIYGVESAVVTCPPGEEIHVDDFGRIKVHFYWDREGKIDDKASCWIRVQQQNTAGSMLLPRVGWEVGVGFLDGDPDRPVVLQKLYNRETMPPYAMPGNKTQSSLQSATTPGGGATNEIRMQDGSGGMEFFVHSSKDLKVEVNNDATEEIKVDVKGDIGLRLDTKVGADEKVTVGAQQSVNVTGNALDQTVGEKKVDVGALDDWGVTGSFTLHTGGDRKDDISALMNVLANQVVETYNATYTRSVGAVLSLNTGSTFLEAVAGSKTETVGGAKLEIVAKAKAEQVGASKTLISGLITEKTGADIGINTKAALTLNVAGPIVEKVGDAFTFGGEDVIVTSAGGAEMKAGGSKVNAKGGKLTVDASSLGAAGGPQLKIKGKINYKE
jgi:type VI secretion system secreted protein VgrG